MQLKKVLAPLVFMTAFALAGSPSAPLATSVPTVGGTAHAYAPCYYLRWNMLYTAAVWDMTRQDWAYDEMVIAYSEYYDHCGS